MKELLGKASEYTPMSLVVVFMKSEAPSYYFLDISKQKCDFLVKPFILLENGQCYFYFSKTVVLKEHIVKSS